MSETDWQTRQKQSLFQAKHIESAMLLMDYMSRISEKYYCAGWLHGLEFDLWEILQGDDPRFGIGEVSGEEIDKLLDLHEKAGGWWHWVGDGVDSGEMFITTGDWIKLFEKERF